MKKASAKIRKSTYSLGWDGPNKNKVSNYLLVTETNARQKAAIERGLRLLSVSSTKEDRWPKETENKWSEIWEGESQNNYV